MIFNFTSFSGLLNMGVGSFLKNYANAYTRPQTELGACKNVQEDRIGVLKRVPGYSKANANKVNLATGNVNFLHYYFQASTNTGLLLAGSNSGSDYKLQYRTTSNWSDLSGYSVITGRADVRLSAVNYLDKTFVVGYDPVDSEYTLPFTIDGTVAYDYGNDADLTNMPGGRFLARYRDLLYVLYTRVSSSIYPSRAYFSSDPVNMALPEWDTTLNFVEFGQDDGDEITGAVEALDKLVVFKTGSMWTYDETNKKKIADIGCDSADTIKVINGILYWANKYGIWRWDGGVPQLISGKVQPVIDAIDQTKLNKMLSVYHGYEYRLYIGDVSVEGLLYENTWIVFDTRRETFYLRCTYDGAMSACKYIENGTERIYFGSDTGYVYKQSMYVDRINSDDGHEIDYFFYTNQLDFGAPYQVKVSPSIYFFTRNAAAMKYIIDGDNYGEFPIYRGQIETNKIYQRDIDVNGYRFIFKFYGKDANDPFEFEGLVVEVNTKEN